MSKYRKFIACLIGFAVIFVKDSMGFDLIPWVSEAMNWVIGILTAAGVWRFPNEPAKTEKDDA